jgi:hypothetical protein
MWLATSALTKTSKQSKGLSTGNFDDPPSVMATDIEENRAPPQPGTSSIDPNRAFWFLAN